MSAPSPLPPAFAASVPPTAWAVPQGVPPPFAGAPGYPPAAPPPFDWVVNEARGKNRAWGALLLVFVSFNIVWLSFIALAGRTPSLLLMVLTPWLALRGVMPFLQKKQTPLRTATSWDAIAFEIPEGVQAHAIASIATISVKASLITGVELRLLHADGKAFRYMGLSGARVRDLRAFVDRRREESRSAMQAWAAQGVATAAAGAASPMPVSVMAPGAPTPTYNAAPGVPTAVWAGQGAASLASPQAMDATGRWNVSSFADGRMVPDAPTSEVRQGGLSQGKWFSTSRETTVRQARVMVPLLMVGVTVLTLRIGLEFARSQFGLVLAVGIALSVAMASAVWYSMRKSLAGEEGLAVMMLSPLYGDQRAVEGLLRAAAGSASLAAGGPTTKKDGTRWPLGAGVEFYCSKIFPGKGPVIRLKTKGPNMIASHTRFKGAVLEELARAVAAAPPPPPAGYPAMGGYPPGGWPPPPPSPR